MHFYKNSKGGPNYLIMDRNEWNRLQKVAGPPEHPTQENEYLKSMVEKSQAWIKTWPDTVQGCVAKVKQQKAKQKAEAIAAAKEFSRKQVRKSGKEAIEIAKQRIFDESCFGNKLLSALRESKTLEERDAQIEFIKEIKKKEAERDKKQGKTVSFCTFNLDKDTAAVEYQKCLKIQQSKENKEMYEKLKADAAKDKEQERLGDLKNAQLMKMVLDREKDAEDKVKLLEREALEQYAAEHKKAKEERAKWEAEYYAKMEECRKEQEILNCKIKKVLKRINKWRAETESTKNVSEMIKNCNEEETKRYDDFIKKSCDKGDMRAAKREKNAKEKEKTDRERNTSTAEFNKVLAENARDIQRPNKCFCDRQCIIVQSEKKRNLKHANRETESCKLKDKEVRQLFFGPSNKLVTELKRREKEPPPFTGGPAAHQRFLKIADSMMTECKYKKPGRKVIDEYRAINGLDATTLPIPNY